MRSKQFIIIILILGSVFGAVSTVWGIQYTPLLELNSGNIYLTAGQENPIELELENKGDFMVYDIQAVLSSANPGITVTSGNHKIWNEIEEEDSVSWEPVIYVNSEVPLGTYGLTLTLSYVKMFNSGAILPEYSTIQVGVIVTKIAVPKLQYLPPKEDLYLTAGSYSDVTFKIKNIWEKEITDLQISIITSTPYINVVEGITHSWEKLDVNDSLTVSPRLYVGENALPSEYLLTIKANYQDKHKNRYHQQFNLPLTLNAVGSPRVTSITINEIKTKPNPVKPGDTFKLELEVIANGAVAYDVTSSLIFNPQNPLSPLSPTVVMIGDLTPSETSIAEYSLLVDGAIPAGQYPLTAIVSFINSKGAPATITETITVLVEGIIEFDLLHSGEIEIVRGASSEVELDLLLIGTQTVRFVDIELISDEFFKNVVGSGEYIGVVDPDSPIPFDINIFVEEEAEAKDYNIKLKVTYTDHLNKEHEKIIDIPVKVVEPIVDVRSAQGISGFWLWLRRLFGITP
jgi:hypothetical protein